MVGSRNWGSPAAAGGGGTRDEVKILLDAKDAFFDGWAWFLHQVQQGRRPPCDCGGGCARCCWTPATGWYDLNRAVLSSVQDFYVWLYGRAGGGHPGHCGWGPFGPFAPAPSASWPFGCPPSRADGCDPSAKLVVAVKKGGKVVASFMVANPTCDNVELQLSVEGFKGPGGAAGPKVTLEPVDGGRAVGARDTRKVSVIVEAAVGLEARTYDGCVLVKTPFTKRLDVEVQVLE